MTPPNQAPCHQTERARDQTSANVAILVLALTASLFLHALLVVALLNGSLPESLRKQDDGVITMRLMPRSILGAEPSKSQPLDEPQDEPQATVPDEAQPVVAETEPGPMSRPAQENEIEPTTENAATLRARLLEQVGALQTKEQSGFEGKLPWTTRGQRVPGLPGARGWISGYVGRVPPSAQTWKENDGSSRGRYVLANGTVVCTHRRAPTISELTNPWKSIAVTMGSICGREQPPAPDFDDPRVQPPPAITKAIRGE